MADPISPTLLTPSDGTTIVGNVLIFTFTVPTDADNDQLVFRIEFDTNSSINSANPNYKKNESRLAQDNKTNGKWEVKDGVGTFVDLPTGGVESTLYGNDAKVTLRSQDTSGYPDSNGVWYWRISASDGLGSAPIFNQVCFGQARFGS